MDISLLQAANFLIANGYILPEGKDKFRLSSIFSRHYKSATQNDPVKFGTPVIATNWEAQYKQFIVDAKVPSRMDAKFGEFQCNSYSESGMKAFKDAMCALKDYDLLVKSVILYYKSTLRYKVAIGRYMTEGIWKGNYDRLATSLLDGTLEEHIKKETADGQQSSYELG